MSIFDLSGQVYVSSDFENGHAEQVRITGDTILLKGSSFLHFMVSGCLSKTPLFYCDNNTGELFHDHHRMVFRLPNSADWVVMDTGYINLHGHYCFFNRSPFVTDTVFIAYWYPYTYSDLNRYMTSLQDCRYIQRGEVRGLSAQGRNLFGYQITDPDESDIFKQHIVFTVRQHAQESPGNWIIQGLTDYLAYSEEPEAAGVRKNAILHIYPMINPDGVYYGGNRVPQPDHNDSWLPGAPSTGGQQSGNHEVDVFRDMIWNDTKGSASISVDIHSHPGYNGRYYWWGRNSGADCVKEQIAADIVARIAFHDGASHHGVAVINNHISSDIMGWPGPWADFWHAESIGSIAFTLEAASAPVLQDANRIMEIGNAIVKGLYDVLPANTPANATAMNPETDSISVIRPAERLFKSK